MDKISSILPSSARVTSVDLKEGQALRPGVPSFGRQEGVSGRNNNRTELLQATAEKASEAQKGQAAWRTKDQQQAAIAQELSNSFFGHNKKDIEEPNKAIERREITAFEEEPARESHPTGFHADEVTRAIKARNFKPEVSFDDDEVKSTLTEPSFFSHHNSNTDSTRKQPDGLYPKGSFIDRSA